MFCKKCGAEIKDINKFCPKCGAAVKAAAEEQIMEQASAVEKTENADIKVASFEKGRNWYDEFKNVIQ